MPTVYFSRFGKVLFAVSALLFLTTGLRADESSSSVSQETPQAAAPASEKATANDAETKVFRGSTLSCVLDCPECSVFARAIKDSGLEETLKNAKECTIFVPTNKAFENWTPNQMEALFNCQPALAALVLNHVCAKTLSPTDLSQCKKLKSCCNHDDCVKMCGEKVAAHCGEFCPKMRKGASYDRQRCDADGKPCLGNGKLCRSVKKYPTAIVQCDNGFVYAIDKVQVPRGLRVYQELQNVQPEPAIIIEEVSAIVAPDDSSTAAEQPANQPVEQPATEGTAEPSSEPVASELPKESE